MHRRGKHRLQNQTHRKRGVLAVLGISTALTAAFLVPASAVTTVSGGDPGTNPPVVRGNTVTISESLGAQLYYRTGSNATNANNAAFTDETRSGLVTLSLLGRACIGDNTAAGGKNNSPRTTITVTGPGGGTVGTPFVSPVRNIITGVPPTTQPAPGNSNYRGDFPATDGTTHGMSFSLNLTGQPAGTYTVTTSQQNMIKTDTTLVQGTCAIGHPDATNKAVVAGPVVTTTTFIYRPWQNTFVDVFGNGKVFTNTVPNEFQFTVGSATSAIYTGFEHFYALPSSATFLLPSDPAACAEDPASCLPTAAVQCDPTAGCTPRIVTIDKVGDGEALQGVFDLQTKAFIATASFASGQRQLLLSLGTQNDAQLHALLAKLAAAAAAHGIDLDSLLATQVRLADGNEEITLSLLNALQIGPSQARGVQIVSGFTVQAGILLDLYIGTTPNTCTTQSGSSTTDPERFTPSTSGKVGYTVQRSDLLPDIPSVGPLGAIAGGPLYHITGNFPSAGTVTNSLSAVAGLDTAADEPNGYPVWVEPFLGSGHVAVPTKLDFLGTATWSAGETSFGAAGCLVDDLMLGTGIALVNNPLPVGFGTLLSPAFKPNAASAALLAKVNGAVQSAFTQVSSNPTVSALLAEIVGALP